MRYDETKGEFVADDTDLQQESAPTENADATPIDFGNVAEDEGSEINSASDYFYTVKPTEAAISDSAANATEETFAPAAAETMVFAAEKANSEESSSEIEAAIDREEWDKIIAEVDAKQAEDEKNKKQVKKKKDKMAKKTKKKKKHPVLKWIIISILLLGIAACVAAFFYVKDIIDETPMIDPDNIYDLLYENSTILDKDGNVLEYVYEGGTLRSNVSYDDIPEDLINALVCTEDKTFFTHHGFNFVRIAGAVWDYVKSGFSERIGGTSTITQQLARNIYLTDTKTERSLNRKIKEAYYTIIIENSLSKEQILEAYLNTVYLGFNSDGVQAAATAYFDKDVEDLSLIECAILASLPQSPNTYSPLKRISSLDVDGDTELDIVARTENWVTYYNDAGEDRVWLILYNMVQQGKLSQEEFDKIEPQLHDLIRSSLCPGSTLEKASTQTSYFTDYVIDEVISDLQTQLGYTEDEAYDLLYKGGLIINSTLDSEIQASTEAIYSNDDNFFTMGLWATTKNDWSFSMDVNDNILQPSNGKVMYFHIDNMFSSISPSLIPDYEAEYNEDGSEVLVDAFILQPSEYTFLEDGSMKVYSGNRLNFYRVQSGDNIIIQIEFKNTYQYIDGELYTTTGGSWTIDSKYTARDSNGDLILDYQTLTTELKEDGTLKNKDYFIVQEDGSIIVNPKIYNLNQATICPQSAFVLIENETGQIRCMIGGRNVKGSKLYNRALATRQTGSSIKPLSTYLGAIQTGYENSLLNKQDGGSRPTYNAATTIDDIPFADGEDLWPTTEMSYWGRKTSLRHALQKSLNCSSVYLYVNCTTPYKILNNLQNMGITSLVTEGEENDINASSLALGGMLNGVSPLEMAAAYACLGNYGVYNSPSCYTTVTNKQGEVIMTAQVETHRVVDEEVASYMLNLLESVVTDGLGQYAAISSQPVAGKTGTTSSNYDLWFCGLTPKYSGTLWLGTDSNLYLDATSSYSATKLWAKIMSPIGEMDPRGEFEMRGDFVTSEYDWNTGMLPVEGQGEGLDTPESLIWEDIFISGTEPTESNETARRQVLVCTETGYLATPLCVAEGCVAYKNVVERPSGQSWESILAGYVKTESLEEMSDEEIIEALSVVADADDDPPDYYCPLHNPNEEEYVVSPFAEDYKRDTSNLIPIEDENDDSSNEDMPDSSDDNGSNTNGTGGNTNNSN